MKNVLLTLLALLSFIDSTFAQNSLKALSSTTGAACYRILYHNQYLYAGTGNTLQVYEVTPSGPPYTLRAERRLGSTIADIQQKDGFLYLAANHAGISKWDLSDPASPSLVAAYQPENLDEAAYDISFFGDSLFVAYKAKVAVFLDQGNTFTLLDRFAIQTGNGKVRGGAIKDSIYACVASYGGASDGVYLYHAHTYQLLGNYPQPYCDPEDVEFGQQTPLLHVLGGSQTTTNPFDPKGCFYSLDITDPTAPTRAYIDTVNTIIGLGISAPQSAVIINDTIYVATQAGMDPDYQIFQPATGQIYVYDATDPANIHRITTLYAGLWHFDLAIHERVIHVASEWYGILTLDISDLMNEFEVGRTLTGGWNTGTAVHGDRMAVANEGYGFKVFDISNPAAPQLVGVNSDSNFCMTLEYSQNGDYIYGYYYTRDGFRVYDAHTLQKVASLPGRNGSSHAWLWKDQAISLYWRTVGARQIFFTDVSDPFNPILDTSYQYKANDILVDDQGKLFLTHNDSLTVLDLGNDKAFVTSVKAGFLQNFHSLAKYKDTVFVYVSNKGLVRYLFDDQANVLIEDAIFPLPYGKPSFMAADSLGLYIVDIEAGMFAYDKASLTQTGYYRTSREFVFTHIWGPQDLFCENGLIFLVEYFGQTTILSNKEGNLLPVENRMEPLPGPIVFPNPFRQQTTIQVDNPLQMQLMLEVFDQKGTLVSRQWGRGNELIFDRKHLPNGLYFYHLELDGQFVGAGKLVVE